MSVYRTLAAVERDLTRHVFRFIDLTADHPRDRCPVCSIENRLWNSAIYGGHPPWWNDYHDQLLCHPQRRARVSGRWWWTKMCPVDGSHYHHRCHACDAVWIRRFKAEEPKSVPL